MCWVSNKKPIPIVLKQPLIVYKVGYVMGSKFYPLFYSRYEYKLGVEQLKINIQPQQQRAFRGICYIIEEGYHSYSSIKRTKEIAKYDINIGRFEIPAGSTVYFNKFREEIVSSSIIYLGILK